MFPLRQAIVSSTKHGRAFIRAVHVEARIDKLGLKLPPPGAPKGNYVSVVRSGNLLFLAGMFIIGLCSFFVTFIEPFLIVIILCYTKRSFATTNYR